MKGGRRSFTRALAVSLAVFALVFSGAILLLDYIGNASDEAQLAVVRDAVRGALATCYAVEGAYPQSIGYLVENYGVQIDTERFTVRYELFASNLMPDITVLDKA